MAHGPEASKFSTKPPPDDEVMASERQEWVKRLLDVCDARIVELAQLDQDHQRAVCDLLTDIRRLRDRLRFELDALP